MKKGIIVRARRKNGIDKTPAEQLMLLIEKIEPDQNWMVPVKADIFPGIKPKAGQDNSEKWENEHILDKLPQGGSKSGLTESKRLVTIK